MSQTGSTALATLETVGLSLLPTLDSLAKTYAGSAYQKVLGTIGVVETFSAEHPLIQTAVNDIAGLLASFFPAAAPVVSALPIAESVLGHIGALAASDPTVQGPAAAPKVVGNTAIAG